MKQLKKFLLLFSWLFIGHYTVNGQDTLFVHEPSYDIALPQSLSNTKKIMRNALEKSYLETYAEEAEIQNEIFGNEQNREAIKAFFEKREPNFD